jgi:putative oxidoreductase
MAAPNLIVKWTSWAPQLLSVLRIMAAFVFMQAGTMKLFAFPIGMPRMAAQPR